jgi:hypothetical protein
VNGCTWTPIIAPIKPLGRGGALMGVPPRAYQAVSREVT